MSSETSASLPESENAPAPAPTATPARAPAPAGRREKSFRADYPAPQRIELSPSTPRTRLERINLTLQNLDPAKARELSYRVYPVQDENASFAATFVALDLIFEDGSRLSEHAHPDDQYGTPLTALAQGASKMLYADQWNLVRCILPEETDGKTIVGAELVYADPWQHRDQIAAHARFSLPLDTLAATRPRVVHAWVEDAYVAPHRPHPLGGDPSLPTTWVDTTRGINSTGDFSRGNTLPITAWPNGFCFWTPVTNLREHRWPVGYFEHYHAIGISHQPSPWMGDRNQLFFAPRVGPASVGQPHTPAHRSGAYLASARAEDATLIFPDTELGIAVIPTDHGGLLHLYDVAYDIEHPDIDTPLSQERVHLLIDSIDDNFRVSWDGQQLTGWVDNGEDDGRVRMFFVAIPNVAPSGFGPVDGEHANARALTWEGSDVTEQYAAESEGIYLRVATSFISVDQARHTLELELPESLLDFQHCCVSCDLRRLTAPARDAWNERLSVIDVEGATPAQLRTLHGCLYRMNLYPNSSHENIGTNENPTWVHASSVLPIGESTDTHTGAQIIPGKTYVNNGFWDTYRTMWPALSLLYPNLAAEMIDGFIQQQREGGWVARWSSPGYADLMTGTSSDVAFADAALRGVPLLDPRGTYEAGLKNATVVPPHPAVGRKGMETSPFTGYVDTRVHESVSWALEGYINDAGLANQARYLADAVGKDNPDEAARLKEDAAYLEARALNYRLLFDERVGFFQGRDASGEFTKTPAEFDPCEWGGDFTETDGWNFAFHAAHDPAGLAALYGGPEGLRQKLDAFFTTLEHANKPGTYGQVIHEMREAQAVRMGQYGFSNQPAHHIAHFYNYAGDIHATQAIVHEVLRRLFVGEEIGQGYPGDEDNGEMSAWWVLNALGIYPLRVGTPEWALGSPLFSRAVVRPLGGEGFEVSTGKWTPDSFYSTAVRVVRKGKSRDVLAPSLTHEELLGSRLEFTMSATRPAPPVHGYGSEQPPSLSTSRVAPVPVRDFARNAREVGGREIPEWTDDSSDAAGQVKSGAVVEVALSDTVRPRFLTLTSAAEEGSDPVAVFVEARTADGTWTPLREISGLHFAWRRELVPFILEAASECEAVRLTFHGAGPHVALAEVEVLG